MTKEQTYQKKYKQSAKYKAQRKAYKRSAKGKATNKRYAQSAKGKATRAKATKTYSHTAKGKANLKKIWNKHMTPERRSWHHMLQRCKHPVGINKTYRGVQVCERWLVFENFLADMGKRPKGTSLSRFGDIGNYKPGNCAWHTRAQQGIERSKKFKVQKTQEKP